MQEAMAQAGAPMRGRRARTGTPGTDDWASNGAKGALMGLLPCLAHAFELCFLGALCAAALASVCWHDYSLHGAMPLIVPASLVHCLR